MDEALDSVGMREYALASPAMLSGGQKQRIAIAGAVAMRPECIVFDEPTAMLDPQGRDRVLKIIRELNDEGITIILITHYMNEAAEADRIVILKKGQVFADGSAHDIFSDKEMIEEAGLGLPYVIELREKAGMPDSVMTVEDIICQLK